MQDVDGAGAEGDHQTVDARGGEDEPCRRRLRSEKRTYRMPRSSASSVSAPSNGQTRQLVCSVNILLVVGYRPAMQETFPARFQELKMSSSE